MIQGIDAVLKQLDPNKVKKAAQASLQVYGAKVVEEAVRTAPADTGKLRQSIKVDFKEAAETLTVNVQAGVFYAPYQEFGTGKKAGQYVSSLPTEWQDIASQYLKTGKGDGIRPRRFLYLAVVYNLKMIQENFIKFLLK